MMTRRQMGYLSWIAQFHIHSEEIRTRRTRPDGIVERALTVRYVTNDDDSVREVLVLYRPNKKIRPILPCNFPHIRDVYKVLQAQGANMLLMGSGVRHDIFVDPTSKGSLNDLESSVIRISRWRYDQREHIAESITGKRL